MNINEFRQYGKQMIDLVANYWESLRKRAPLPNVKLGFINELVLPLFIEITNHEAIQIPRCGQEKSFHEIHSGHLWEILSFRLNICIPILAKFH